MNNSCREPEDLLFSQTQAPGELTAESLRVHRHLQEFAEKIGYFCHLVNQNQVSRETAYRQIKSLWQQLEQLKQELPDSNLS